MLDEVIIKRINFLIFIVVLTFLVLLSRIYYLQIIKGSYFREIAKKHSIRFTYLPSHRGIIYDRNGIALLENKPSFYVYFLACDVDRSNYKSVLSKISFILDFDYNKLEKMYLENPYSYKLRLLKKDVNIKILSLLLEQNLEYNGIIILNIPKRYYLYDKICSHIIGYTSIASDSDLKRLKYLSINDIVGKAGIERYYDKLLRGKKGMRRFIVNAYGRPINVLQNLPPQNGYSLYLTLDIRLQKFIYNLLERKQDELFMKNGVRSPIVAIAMKKNGEVLAMVSLPSYSGNMFSKGFTQKEYEKEILSKRFSPLINRAINGLYSPGSTFKVVTAIAGLQEGVIKKDVPLYCPGYFDVSGHKFYCFNTYGHGYISLEDAIGQSCDVYFYKVGYNLGIKRLRKWAARFGIGKKTGIDLPAESSGLLPSPEWKKKYYKEKWYKGDTVNLSIGQGFLLVTPLQMAKVVSILLNNGIVYKPHLLYKWIDSSGKEVFYKVKKIDKLPVKNRYFDYVKAGMRRAVLNGTSTAANVYGLSICGKTGTVENSPTPLNPRGLNHTWFESFANYKDPQIIVVVFFQQSGGYGGQWAVPVARDIIKYYFKLKEKH